MRVTCSSIVTSDHISTFEIWSPGLTSAGWFYLMTVSHSTEHCPWSTLWSQREPMHLQRTILLSYDVPKVRILNAFALSYPDLRVASHIKKQLILHSLQRVSTAFWEYTDYTSQARPRENLFGSNIPVFNQPFHWLTSTAAYHTWCGQQVASN